MLKTEQFTKPCMSHINRIKQQTRSPPTGVEAKRRATIIRPNAVWCGIYDRFLNFDNCQPEAVRDVISGVFIEPTRV